MADALIWIGAYIGSGLHPWRGVEYYISDRREKDEETFFGNRFSRCVIAFSGADRLYDRRNLASVNDGGSSSGTVSAGNEAWDSSKKDKIVLSVINNYYTAGWKQMAEEYMKLHPETEVVVDVVADNDAYTQKVTTWLTSDDLTQAADIIHINFASGPNGGYNVMYEKDMIYDFNDMMDETNPYNGGKKVSEAFNKDDLPLLQDLGKQYALPFDFVGVAIMYNKDILDKTT